MTDSTFAGVGQVAGLEVWRIEKLHPVVQENVSLFCSVSYCYYFKIDLNTYVIAYHYSLLASFILVILISC